MHLAHRALQVFYSLVPVEHGRELEHREARLLEKLRQKLHNVGRAVGEHDGLGAVLVAARRVEEYHCLHIERREIVDSVSADHLCVVDAEQRQVVLHHVAELRVALYVCG